MMRKVALCALLSIVAACATRRADAPPAEAPAALAADPRVCAEVQRPPAMPAGASIVQPVTIEEQLAVSLFLTWTAELVDNAELNADRAELARKGACPGA